MPARVDQGRSPALPTTHWSVVLAAGDQSSPESENALKALCESYWYPLYAFTRRQGFDVDHAADLTQSFFEKMLEKGFLKSVDRAKGRFRSFLLACMKHFISNQRARARAQKRGGGAAHVPLDTIAAEEKYAKEVTDEVTPEHLYHRRWALTLLDHVLVRVRAQYADRGRLALFEALKGELTGGTGRTNREIGAELGMSEGAVKVAAHRLRSRYREVLRAEIGRTVDDPADIDSEIEELFDALR